VRSIKRRALPEGFSRTGQRCIDVDGFATRYAMAQREIAWPYWLNRPATKGYPLRFRKITQLVERAGIRGSWARLHYGVLHSIDGRTITRPSRGLPEQFLMVISYCHVTLAEERAHPAIDIEASISRVMPWWLMPIILPDAIFDESILVSQNRRSYHVRAYVPGTDKDIEFFTLLSNVCAFLRQFMQQGLRDKVSLRKHYKNYFTESVVPAARSERGR